MVGFLVIKDVNLLLFEAKPLFSSLDTLRKDCSLQYPYPFARFRDNHRLIKVKLTLNLLDPFTLMPVDLALVLFSLFG